MIRRLLFSISLVSLCLLASPPIASAKDLFPTVCTGAANSAACKDKTSSNPLTGNNGALLDIVNIVAYIAGGIAVIVIIVGAIRYITSGSDTSVGSRIDDDVKNAKNTISGALIGIAIIVLAKTLITYVVKRL